MSKKIQNIEVEVPTGSMCNDKDYLNFLLETLKEEIKNYTVALTEASNEKLYKKLKENFEELSQLQRKSFELAFANGWYILQTADDTIIKKEYKKLNQEITDLQIENE